jgi:hypothetical protein
MHRSNSAREWELDKRPVSSESGIETFMQALIESLYA